MLDVLLSLPFGEVLEIREMQPAAITLVDIEADIDRIWHVVMLELEVVVVLSRINLHARRQAPQDIGEDRNGVFDVEDWRS